ncbi:hypothetical protein BX616_001929 [Lobosporangium transversale]|uniref:Kinase-like domain-containing protein n=1 Tax=Lobosporangium transversale TaxID=64571 RepID=A0A1Y2GAZ5_9FUNG|nr:kinase-like domain-containing protein [Lobosporangium transversale]KAF9917108.1 hypothetical protein BX616_001929 [Lobosporangium transversale]ORZ05893.1 kinase-like domain-containing protein [Lobosporangium transversale]|eukprot:XP_021877274.1 kinase-like domain-containing protein [Lobosporangium transversale]
MTVKPTPAGLHHSPSPFRPGSIFYNESASEPYTYLDTSTPSSTTTSQQQQQVIETKKAHPQVLAHSEVSLASPPPSPSRNSIFDQPWSGASRPNISSLRASSSNNVTTTNGINKDAIPRGSSSTYGSKIHQHQRASSPIYNMESTASSNITTTAAATSSLRSPAPARLVNSRSLSYDQGQLQRSILSSHQDIVHGTPRTSSSHRILRSPVHVPRSLPSPSLPPSSSSIFLPPMSLNGHGPSVSSCSQHDSAENAPPFSLNLDCSKANLLGYGRHSEVYKALIHPSSSHMRQYLHTRKTLRAMSCQDVFQQSKEDITQSDTIVCAAKCLSSDADSQSAGLAEAAILRRLHTTQVENPGRLYLVDYLGLYDQAKKQIISVVESSSHERAVQSDHQDGQWTLLLEYCQNGSMWDWIRQNPEKVGFRRWLTWSLQLLQAVDCIHDAGLIHHDIKPHNILLDSFLDAKLSDFGAGRFLSTPDTTGSIIGDIIEAEKSKAKDCFSLEEGRGRGTPPYSAPEMFASSSTCAYYGRPIDIYSLGVSLYVIGLTAHEPFHKVKSMIEMIVWIKKGGFWLWEDQSWVHDRGPIPKVTPSSRLSASSAAQAQAQASIINNNESKERRQGGPRSTRASFSALHTLNLPPINTQLAVARSCLSPTSICSATSSAGATGLYKSPIISFNTSNNHFLNGHSPERSARSSQPSTPISPLPLPSPTVKSSAARSTPRKDEQRKSGEIVMRFLNGEVVPIQVIQLLKDMCQADPEQRPTAKAALQRLQEIQAQLDATMGMDMDTDVDLTENTIV